MNEARELKATLSDITRGTNKFRARQTAALHCPPSPADGRSLPPSSNKPQGLDKRKKDSYTALNFCITIAQTEIQCYDSFICIAASRDT
eukprot:6196869-Pleurochrysis_carterae.AAC.2